MFQIYQASQLLTDVSLSDVQGWVEAALGSDEVTALKAGIDAQIAEKITPSSVNRTIS